MNGKYPDPYYRNLSVERVAKFVAAGLQLTSLPSRALANYSLITSNINQPTEISSTPTHPGKICRPLDSKLASCLSMTCGAVLITIDIGEAQLVPSDEAFGVPACWWLLRGLSLSVYLRQSLCSITTLVPVATPFLSWSLDYALAI